MSKTSHELLAERVRDYIERQDTGVYALAERAGLTGTGLSLILNGHRCPKLDTLDGIARALRVPAWALVSDARTYEMVSDNHALIDALSRASPAARAAALAVLRLGETPEHA